MITHKTGFAYLKSAEAPVPERIRLTPWARVEGTFRAGSKPLADVSLDLSTNAIQSHGEGEPSIFTRHDTTTGPDGRFVFERVFPGDGRLGRNIVFMVDDGATEVTSSKKVRVQLTAGETSHVDVGGDGRPVVGKLEPAAGVKDKVLWNFAIVQVNIGLPKLPAPPVPAGVQNDQQRYQVWWKEWQLTDEGQAWSGMLEANERMTETSPGFTASIDRNGTFRIDDVPPGNYVLSVRFDKQNAVGQLRDYKFAVSASGDENSEEPIDLGVLQLER